MFKTNQYFDGAVVSIGLEAAEGTSTLGVMKAGEYEFGTSTVEYMTVISGELEVQQPGESEWKSYKKLIPIKTKQVMPKSCSCVCTLQV